jgi:hypothetical protein
MGGKINDKMITEMTKDYFQPFLDYLKSEKEVET